MDLDKKSILTFTPADSFKNIVADTTRAGQEPVALPRPRRVCRCRRDFRWRRAWDEVETIEHQQDNGLGISVYFGQHKGSASTSNLDPEAIRKTVEAACNIARYTSEDPCTGLADAEFMAREFHALDLYHPWEFNPRQVIDLALECENAALDYDQRVSSIPKAPRWT